MAVRNDLDRFHLVNDVLDRVPGPSQRIADLRQFLRDKHLEHEDHIRRYGQDLPEIRNWRWPYP